MKKHYKLLAVFVAVVLVVCCCCIPVFAATINAGTGNKVFVGDTSAGPVINGNQNSNGSYWINYYAGRTDDTIGLLFPIDLVISRGDIVKWSSFYTNYYFSLSSTVTVSVSLGLMDDYYIFYSLEDRVYSSNMSGSFDVQFLGGSKQFTEDIDAKYICIMLNGYYNQTSAGTFSWYPYSFKLSSADENTIMIEGMISEQQKTNELLGDITADKYTPPSDDSVSGLGAVEDSIINDSQDGLNVLTDKFKAFSLDTFTDSLGGMVTIYNRIIPYMPWLNELLNISLILGLFAFVFGISINYFNSYEDKPIKHDKEYYEYTGDPEGKWLL